MIQVATEQLLELGIQHFHARRFPEAEAACAEVLAREPQHAGALQLLGILAGESARLDLAAECFRRALAQRPDDAGLHNNLGNVCKTQGRIDDAVAWYRRALELAPGHAKACDNLAACLKERGEVEEAVACYRRAVELSPDNALWHSNLVQALNYDPRSDRRSLYTEARQWAAQHAARFETAVPRHGNGRQLERRLRIGYYSADFVGNRPCGLFIAPLLAHHDHRGFEIFCYAQVERPDGLTARMQGYADHWLSTAGMRDETLAERIGRDGIDILVDLQSHTRDHRLLMLARKPAPVQVNWIAYPGTTGLTAIDYRLTDPYLDPPGEADVQACSAEKLVRLAHTYWCYDPCAVEAVGVLPALGTGRVTFGCLCDFMKTNARVLELWGAVLAAVPGARLVLRAPEGVARQRALGVFAGAGVAPERIEFVASVPRPEYLKKHQAIDICLDTFPYNGHTTSLDALWMGVPVVTLVGSTACGRAGLGLLTNLGLEALVARSPEQYVTIAAKLAGDLHALAALRATLRGRMEQSPLMDGAGFARGVETAYREMWRSWCGRT